MTSFWQYNDNLHRSVTHGCVHFLMSSFIVGNWLDWPDLRLIWWLSKCTMCSNVVYSTGAIVQSILSVIRINTTLHKASGERLSVIQFMKSGAEGNSLHEIRLQEESWKSPPKWTFTRTHTHACTHTRTHTHTHTQVSSLSATRGPDWCLTPFLHEMTLYSYSIAPHA